MKKKYFDEYSEFLFNVLEEVEKRADHENYTVEHYRTLGHLGERMLGIYIDYAKSKYEFLDILYVPPVRFVNTTPLCEIKPVKTEKQLVPICLACNDKYVKYASVLICSFIENAVDSRFYDIVILTRDICDTNANILKSMVRGKKNISLRIADVSSNFEKHSNLFISRHLTYETYYRFMILDIFKEYEKVLYMDCDMLAVGDVGELFDIDIEGNCAGVVRDLDFITQASQENTYT